MTMFIKHAQLPYANSEACLQALAGIEAIDFFFAQQILATYAQTNNAVMDTDDNIHTLFHVLVALSYFQRQGHICIDIANLAGQALFTQSSYGNKDARNVNNENVTYTGFQFPEQARLRELLQTWVSDLHRANNEVCFVVFENDYLYSKRYFYYEQQVCKYLKSVLQGNMHGKQHEANAKTKLAIIDELKVSFAKLFNTPLVSEQQIDKQQLAVLNALFNQFSIITGGAGTGKTYTVARLVLLLSKVFSFRSDEIELVAPTGKAANRLIESFQNELSLFSNNAVFATLADALSNIQSKTLHRLLKIDPATGVPRYNQQNKLAAKVLIIDEASMLDISLMHKVIEALHDNTKLILVGDANQLPSVESGSLLADLVSHPKGGMSQQRKQILSQICPELASFSIQELSDSYSYVSRLSASKRSSIAIQSFAESILLTEFGSDKKLISTSEVGVLEHDFSDRARCLQNIVSTFVVKHFVAIQSATNLQAAFTQLKHYAFLTPFREGPFGVNTINALVEHTLAGKYSHIRAGQFYKGMPIMVQQNDYQLGLFNGDIGIIWPNEEGKLMAYFAAPKEQFLAMPLFSLPRVQTTYAMTIHKTQGSEYQEVDLLLPPQGEDFLSKQLVYTGVTRAKSRIIVHTTANIFNRAIQQSIARVSGIEKRLD